MTALVIHGLPPALLATSLIWRARLAPDGWRGLWLSGLLGLVLALGLAGFDSLVVRLLWPALIGREWVLELPLAAAAGAWALRTPRGPGRDAAPPRVTGWRLVAVIVLTASLMLAIGAALSAIVQTFLMHAHGSSSDAWSVWNRKARFLYRGGERVWLVFDPQLVHSRYPLLLPGLVARVWGALGNDTPAGPQGLVLSFFGLVIGILVTTLHALRGWVVACLSGLSLLSLPFFVKVPTYQGADLPLSLFALASLSCLVISIERPDAERGALVLAGAFAGFAAWTKVEGLLALGLLAAVPFGRGTLRLRLRRAGFLLAGALPLLAALFLVNSAYLRAPSEYLYHGPGIILDRVRSFDRHRQIVTAAVRFALAEGQRVPLALLAAAGLAWRFARRGSARSGLFRSWLALCLVGAGFYAAYLVTPYPLDWQLRTSLSRLFIQYWPSLVLLAFLGGPERAAPSAGEAPEVGIEPTRGVSFSGS